MDLTSLARFHIAPGGDPAVPDGWVWVDRSQDVNSSSPITITGGRADETSEIEASSASLEVDNAGGHYCTRNPLGRWSGLLARNCPARWGTITGAEAFGAAVVNGWGVPDVGTSWTLEGSSTLWQVSGGVGQATVASANVAQSAFLNGADCRNGDAVFAFSTPVVATGAAILVNLQARFTSGSNHLLFSAEMGLSGVLTARIRRQNVSGFTDLATAVMGFTYTTGQRYRMRSQWDGAAVRIKIWIEASGEPAAWTAVGTDTTCQGSKVGLRFWRVAGNTNAGGITFTVDDLEVEGVEIVGTIPEFPVRWDPTATVSWAPIQIAGITRRLSQGQRSLHSPMYRQLGRYAPAGFWPLEDLSDSKVAASAVSRGKSASCVDVTFGVSAPAGAASAAQLNSGSSEINGSCSGPATADGYAGMILLKLPSLPGSQVTLMTWKATGTVTDWKISGDSTGFFVAGTAADGTVIVAPGIGTLYGVDPTKWWAMQLETNVSGGTVNWSFIMNQVGLTSFGAVSGSYSGTASRMTGFKATGFANTCYTMSWIGDNDLPFVDGTFLAISAGYAGELASDRIARLAAEENIPMGVEPGASEPLAPQKTGTFLELLRSAEQADQGLLYESGAGFGYRPHGARNNPPIAMTLAIGPDGDVADPAPEPTDDDLRVRNEWELTREGGSSATATNDAHIKANGRYPDSATVSIQTDDRLADHASWRVRLGTVEEMRWPTINIDLTDKPTLLTAWRGRRHGPRLEITGIPSQGPVGANAALLAEGWVQTITSVSWTVALACSPARAWDVAVYNTSRADSLTTTTAGTLTSAPGTGVTLALSTVNPKDAWSQTSTPYVITVAGEDMTVTAMSAPVGTTPVTQNGTVNRGANGILKAHAVGEAVTLAATARPHYAL